MEDVRRARRPLEEPGDLDPLLDAARDARVVLLGEATHGTSQFYAWRAAITRRLVREHGFTFVAVEGDWPDCAGIDAWLKGRADHADARAALRTFRRWPTWMWANAETAEFLDWLRSHDAWTPAERRVGFYGLDVYSLHDSLRIVVERLRRTEPDAARIAQAAWRCFEPYLPEPHEYGRAAALVPHSCEKEVVALLREAAQARVEEGAFDLLQNAAVARNAERYYRAMVSGGTASWNVRDRHMDETLARLLEHHGPDSRAVVWAHNTHVGDARWTDMADDGMVNLGQLARERYPGRAFVVGFGTHRGTVVAARAWDAPPRRLRVPPARVGSWEDVLHLAFQGDGLLLPHELRDPEAGRRRGQRAIGVVYEPSLEAYGNYVPTVLGRRYDAFLHVDETHALEPIEPLRVDVREEETWPFGY